MRYPIYILSIATGGQSREPVDELLEHELVDVGEVLLVERFRSSVLVLRLLERGADDRGQLDGVHRVPGHELVGLEDTEEEFEFQRNEAGVATSVGRLYDLRMPLNHRDSTRPA